MIKAPYSLPERPLPQELLYLISVPDVIIHADLVVALVVVIPVVELILHGSLRLALAVLAHVVYLWVVYYLLQFILSEVIFRVLECDLGGGGFFDVGEAIDGRGCFEGLVGGAHGVH